MWRVQRLDQINCFKPANLLDSKSLTLSFSCKQIGRFKTVREDRLRPSFRVRPRSVPELRRDPALSRSEDGNLSPFREYGNSMKAVPLAFAAFALFSTRAPAQQPSKPNHDPDTARLVTSDIRAF